MPAHPEEPKRPSSGLTAKIDAAVIHRMEKKALAAAAHEQKTFPLRRVMGAVALGVWMIFMMTEFFHWVEHVDSFGHDLTKWAPLFVGLLLLAPDAFDKLVAFVGRLKGLKVSLPPKQDDPPE
jgi:hypothetical protein